MSQMNELAVGRCSPAMRPILLLPLFLLLSACQPSAEVVPPAKSTPPPTPTAPIPLASAEAKLDAPAPAPSEEKVFPLPPTPPGADPEKVAFAASICAAAAIEAGSGTVAIGCRSNPPFDKPGRRPDGVLASGLDAVKVCTIDHIYRGSFTRPGAKEAALAFGTCDDGGPWNGSMPGSVVVVEESPTSKWKVVTYEPELNANGCLIDRRPDGRDILVCHDNFGAYSSGALRWFYSIDLSRKPKQRVDQLAKMFQDDFPVPCGPSFPPEFLSYGVTRITIKSFVLADANKDGKKDLVATVQRANVPASKALEARIEALCKKGAEQVESSAYLPPAKEFTLEFLNDGHAFVPTPATQKLLAAWRAGAPDSWWNLR